MGGEVVSMRPVLVVLVEVLLLLAVAPAPAAEPEEVQLALADVLRTALENNLDLVQARIDPEIAGHAVEAEEGAYDPVLTSNVGATQRRTEALNEFVPSTDDTVYGAGVGVQEALKFGAQYSAVFDTSRAEGDSYLFEPSWRSQLALNFDLPLLRGRGTENTTESLLLARGNLEISREELRRQAVEILERVEGAYWDVLAAHEAVRVAYQALTRAEDLLELNRKKVEVGTLAPIEITQAEAGVASQREGVILSEEARENAQDEIRRLLAIPPGDALWSRRLVPIDRPGLMQHPAEAVDVEAAITQALASRPELVSARQDLRNRELSERVAHNAVLPGLGLHADVTPIGNNLIETIPGTIFTPTQYITDGLPESLEEITRFDNYTWNVGFQLDIPLGNRTAKASYRIATLDRQRAEVSLQNLEQNIRVEVRQAARAVESGRQRVEAAQANVLLQQKKLEAEQKKFENGMSTSFEVLTFQNDLSDAELSLIRAALDYVKATTALERAKGTLLETRNLRVETP
jgi:outer membrane protein TolC